MDLTRESNGNTLQYSFLENPLDRGAWKAAVHGVARSWTQLSKRTDNETGWPISHEIHLVQHVFSPDWRAFTLPVISTTVKIHTVLPPDIHVDRK